MILLLHPGQMGAAVGAALVGNGHDTGWVAAGRSAATRARAAAAGLHGFETLASGLRAADMAMSICPPDAALELARQVRREGFRGVYVDGNAVAPETARAIAALFGARYVDGGIIGPPPRSRVAGPSHTRFYLAGAGAADVAALFADSPVDARTLAGDAAAASALKMCFAAYTKGVSALLLGIRALAERNGVTDDLLAEWRISQRELPNRSTAVATSTGPKAWRFAGEMRQIAATFAAAGLPSGFHEGAAEIYQRMAGLKDLAEIGIDDALRSILDTGAGGGETADNEDAGR